MPRILREIAERLRGEGYYLFGAKFHWDFSQDGVAKNKFKDLFDKLPEGIDRDSMLAYLFTGERTMVVIGYTNSPVALQEFCSSVSHGTAIEARFSHVVEVHELANLTSNWPIEKETNF